MPMSESGEKNKSSESEVEKNADTGKLDGISLDLDFAPSWARTSPEEHIKTVKSSRYDGEDGSYGRRDGRRNGRRDSWRDNKRDERFNRRDRDGKRGDRRPPRRRDGEQDSYRKPRREESGAPVASFGPPSGAPQGGPGGYNNRRPNNRQGDRGGYRGRPRVEHPPLPLEIRVLPEQKALGGVIRRIQSSHRAFPLRDIAWLFLDKPASCLIRVAQRKEEPIPLFQCKVCGIPALTEDEIQNHLLNRHLDEFFDVEEVDCEPPGGQYVCVMRCGITGVLLGPPNHHSFNTKVQEMLRSKFPNMSEEAYRRKIESVREPELIEEWRQSCTKKKIYRRKTAEALPAEVKDAQSAESAPATEAAPAAEANVDADVAKDVPAEAAAATDPTTPEITADDNEVKAPPMERDVAELVFKREMLPQQYASVKHLVCIASVALQTPSKRLYFAIKDMIHKERRFPTSLFFALRGAFRHRKLHLFRAKEAKGPDFVMQKKPSELDPSHAVEMVKEVLAHIHENPACTKAELVHALAGTDEAKIKEILGQLAWLIEKGNVIEYYNDVLSAPLEYPSFKLLPGEMKRGGKRSESVAATAVSGEDVSAPKAPKAEEAAKDAEPDKKDAEKAPSDEAGKNDEVKEAAKEETPEEPAAKEEAPAKEAPAEEKKAEPAAKEEAPAKEAPAEEKKAEDAAAEASAEEPKSEV